MSGLFDVAPRPFYALGFVVLAIFALSAARDYAVPIAIAILIWFLINALAAAIRRIPEVGSSIPRWLAKSVSVAVLFGLITIGVNVIVMNVSALSASVPEAGAGLLAKLEGLLTPLGLGKFAEAGGLQESLEIERAAGWVLSVAQGLISDISLVFLYVMFLLADEGYYEAKLRALVADEERRADLRRALDRIAGETRAYLWLMTVLSLGVALATYAAAAAVGLPGAGFWGFVAFALNFIPTIGSITAVVLPVVYALLTLEDPVMLIGLIAALSAIQVVAGELVMPRLMGDRLNLSSAVILLMLVVWGAMWGPAGMFLAIPITVILAFACAHFPATRPVAVILSKDGRVPEI